MKNYIFEILKDLVDIKVEFIIGGGVAAVLHGVERVTVDIDISLNMTEKNIKKFLTVMDKHNMKPRIPIPGESLIDPDIVDFMVKKKNAIVFTFIDSNNPFKHIDVFLEKNKSYFSVLNDTISLELEDGVEIKIISIDKLLEMKKEINPPRDKDERDIRELIKIVRDKEFGNKSEQKTDTQSH